MLTYPLLGSECDPFVPQAVVYFEPVAERVFVAAQLCVERRQIQYRKSHFRYKFVHSGAEFPKIMCKFTH